MQRKTNAIKQIALPFRKLCLRQGAWLKFSVATGNFFSLKASKAGNTCNPNVEETFREGLSVLSWRFKPRLVQPKASLNCIARTCCGNVLSKMILQNNDCDKLKKTLCVIRLMCLQYDCFKMNDSRT